MVLDLAAHLAAEVRQVQMISSKSLQDKVKPFLIQRQAELITDLNRPGKMALEQKKNLQNSLRKLPEQLSHRLDLAQSMIQIRKIRQTQKMVAPMAAALYLYLNGSRFPIVS